MDRREFMAAVGALAVSTFDQRREPLLTQPIRFRGVEIFPAMEFKPGQQFARYSGYDLLHIPAPPGGVMSHG